MAITIFDKIELAEDGATITVAQYNAAAKMYNDLTELHNKLETTYESVKDGLSVQLADATSKIEELRDSKTELMLAYNTLQTNYSNLSSQVGEYRSQVDSLNATNATLKSNIEEQKKQISTHTTQMADIVREKAALTSSNSTLISEKESLQQQLESKNTELSSKNTQLSTVQSQLGTLQNQNAEYVSSNAALSSQLQSVRDSNEALSTQVSTANTTISNLNAEITRIGEQKEQQRIDFEGQIATLNASAVQKDKDIADKAALISDKDKTIQGMETELASKDSEISGIKAQFNTIKVQLQQEIDAKEQYQKLYEDLQKVKNPKITSVSVDVNFDDIEHYVCHHLSVIGKRAKDNQGTALFSTITASSPEMTVVHDYIESAAHKVVATLSALVKRGRVTSAVVPPESADDKLPTLIHFEITNSRWEAFEGERFTAVIPGLIRRFCQSYTIAEFLNMFAPTYAKKYEAEELSILQDIKSLSFFHEHAEASEHSYSSLSVNTL